MFLFRTDGICDRSLEGINSEIFQEALAPLTLFCLSKHRRSVLQVSGSSWSEDSKKYDKMPSGIVENQNTEAGTAQSNDYIGSLIILWAYLGGA